MYFYYISCNYIPGDNPARPVFGTKLETHLESSGRTVAFPIEVCICALLEVGLEEEGLFRVAGGMHKIFDWCKFRDRTDIARVNILLLCKSVFPSGQDSLLIRKLVRNTIRVIAIPWI
jgi:molybdenum cofactor biosynthesis enzyme